MADNKIATTIESLFKGMDTLVSTKTVVGQPIDVNGTTIVPLVDVSFGMGAGASGGRDKGTGGMGGKVTPTAVLVIQDGKAKMVSVKSADVASKVVDLIPELMEKFTAKKNEPDVDIDELLDEAAK